MTFDNTDTSVFGEKIIVRNSVMPKNTDQPYSQYDFTTRSVTPPIMLADPQKEIEKVFEKTTETETGIEPETPLRWYSFWQTWMLALTVTAVLFTWTFMSNHDATAEEKLSNEIATANDDLTVLKQENESLQEHITSLNQNNETLNSKLDTTLNTLQETQKELDTATSEITKLTSLNKTAKDDLAEAQKSLTDSQSQYKETKDQLRATTEQLAKIEGEKDTWQQTALEMAEELGRPKTELPNQ